MCTRILKLGSAPCAQLSAEYAIPHLTLKSAVGLTNQPKVDLAASTGYKDIVVGGEATYDSAKGQVTRWAAGVGARSLPPPRLVCVQCDSTSRVRPRRP